MRILLVEDEPELRRQVSERLEREGYQVQGTGEGNEGLYLAGEYAFDTAIVDIGLPGISGIEVIRRLRKKGSLLPILVLTARGRWQDKVEGLEAGADDFLTKPFQMEELLARVKALLRRASGAASQELQFGPIRLDLAAQKVWVEDAEVELTTFEYRVLEHLVTHRNKVVSKQELADHLYAQDEDRDSNVLEVLVGRLRRKLDPSGRLSPIETVRGRGYRFAVEDGARE
ncbi:MAG TPA: response regulator transcription factor [Burkholderiales bacterium]|nr:response regulator transcription factor [Burkholderiales bacterium]